MGSCAGVGLESETESETGRLGEETQQLGKGLREERQTHHQVVAKLRHAEKQLAEAQKRIGEAESTARAASTRAEGLQETLSAERERTSAGTCAQLRKYVRCMLLLHSEDVTTSGTGS